MNVDAKEYLELVIKNNFLESQNVQLLLNLQLQARTIIDLKNMITKQQKFIEDYDIAGTNITEKNLEMFLDDGNEGEGNEEEFQVEDQEQNVETPSYSQSTKESNGRGAQVRQSYNGALKKEEVQDLQIMGIPVSNRPGKKSNPLSGEVNVKDQRGLKPKSLKDQREQKEADFKQSIEGLSIVGMSAKNKK